MKKALSLLITAAMLMAMLAVMAPAAFAAETVSVGTADELIDVVTKINAGELAADTNITLSADIDLAGKAWKPLKAYSGTFDGAGYTIKNLTQTVKVENNDANKLNQGGGTNNAVYVIADYESKGGNGSNCFGEAGFALLAVKGEGATFKSFTLKDSSLNVTWSFNKNWQPFYGGVVACLNGGSISDVKLENVDIPVDEPAAENQGYLGFAGLIVGATSGEVTIENCSVDADSTLDASANKKFDVAAIVGRHSSESPLTVIGCTTAATIKAAPDVSNKDGLMYTAEDSMLGGWAAAVVARFNDNTVEGARDLIVDCENTGTITGAKTNADNLLVGDLNTRTDISYEAPECQHTGGEATCKDKAVCIECGEKYGEIDSDNHGETKTVGAKEATETEEGYTGDTVCKACGEVQETGEVIPVKEPATDDETPDPVDPPVTGDVVLTVSALALAAATGAVVIARKRKIEE